MELQAARLQPCCARLITAHEQLVFPCVLRDNAGLPSRCMQRLGRAASLASLPCRATTLTRKACRCTTFGSMPESSWAGLDAAAAAAAAARAPLCLACRPSGSFVVPAASIATVAHLTAPYRRKRSSKNLADRKTDKHSAVIRSGCGALNLQTRMHGVWFACESHRAWAAPQRRRGLQKMVGQASD